MKKNPAPADEEPGGGGEISRRIELAVSFGESLGLGWAAAVLGRQGARDGTDYASAGKTTQIRICKRIYICGFYRIRIPCNSDESHGSLLERQKNTCIFPPFFHLYKCCTIFKNR